MIDSWFTSNRKKIEIEKNLNLNSGLTDLIFKHLGFIGWARSFFYVVKKVKRERKVKAIETILYRELEIRNLKL